MKKIQFSDLREDFKIRKCATPYSVFVTENPDDETVEQGMQVHEKFLKLISVIRG